MECMEMSQARSLRWWRGSQCNHSLTGRTKHGTVKEGLKHCPAKVGSRGTRLRADAGMHDSRNQTRA